MKGGTFRFRVGSQQLPAISLSDGPGGMVKRWVILPVEEMEGTNNRKLLEAAGRRRSGV